MQRLSLDGTWKLNQEPGKEALPARVPGCVHLDLLAAKRIEDPFYRDRELDVQWVSWKTWVYMREFEVPASLLKQERVVLHCEGLDTFAELKVNGKQVGKADNMFRVWEWDVKDLLKKGRNRIAVRFEPVLPYTRARQAERYLHAWNDNPEDPGAAQWVRKEPCNFGWDWGPRLVTCGIWRSIALLGYSTARIADVEVAQDHGKPRQVTLSIRVQVEVAGEQPLRASVRVQRGEQVLSAEADCASGAANLSLTVKNPELWWPNGMGEQPLYDLEVTLLNADGGVLDTMCKRLGLRTLRLEQKSDEWGTSFQFAANGVPFFAKGANWIPPDVFQGRVAREDYERLLRDAVTANMNFIRVWGGGIYEEDAFYDLCDELGLCVWQDFMFACATYPTFDDDYMANVRAEVEDNVRRLRHHACLALWCGNNELEQGLVGPVWNETQMSWDDYTKLFDRLIPEVVHRLDPERDYIPSSAYTPPPGDRTDANDPDHGDAHLWYVWHQRYPFEWYRTSQHRFCSEFGFQSFPAPLSVESFTRPEDRNVTSYVMEHHQRSPVGNGTIIAYMADWFRLPKSFESTIWLSQILHGLAMKYAVEHWRRNMPRCMGAIYWQLNDCWPVVSWSSIEYNGRWKALHYMAKRFFAPLMVSLVEDTKAGTVEVHLTSDESKARQGKLHLCVSTPEGRELYRQEKSITLRPRTSRKAFTVDLRKHLKDHGPRGLLVWAALEVDGSVVSSDLATFVKPKHIDLPEPGLRTKIKALRDGQFAITITAKRPALYVWLDIAGQHARLSDNFFHVMPGQPVTVEVTPEKAMEREELETKLSVVSLVDTYE